MNTAFGLESTIGIRFILRTLGRSYPSQSRLTLSLGYGQKPNLGDSGVKGWPCSKFKPDKPRVRQSR